ncbi:MAG: helix-turn-helix domain-containing protein [Tannerellaceae bacterium]
MEQILAQRLKSARLMKGLSMDDLCERIGNAVSKQSISKYENGKMMPDSTVLIALSNALDVPIDYFFRPYRFEFPDVEFRKKSKLGSINIQGIKELVRDHIERYFEIENILELNHDFKIDFSNVTIQSVVDVKDQAKRLRELWSLGEDGISSVVSVLEENNIKVIELDASDDFDGLSGFINHKNPVIVLNQNFTSERLRFTALHELGHLLLNFDKVFTRKEIENMCNLFANEMLISSRQFIKLIGSSRKEISLQELISIQKQYGISIDALMYKAKELNVITDNRYKGYCIKKNQYPELKSQVIESRFPIESSDRFMTLVFRAISDEIISFSKAASLLGKSINDVKSALNYI